jgi:hypothetical protein
MRIEWSDAGRVSARRFMRDQDGLRAVGLAVADDPYPAEAFHRGTYHRPSRQLQDPVLRRRRRHHHRASRPGHLTKPPGGRIPTRGGPLIEPIEVNRP